MEQLLTLLAGHKALRPADADVELKKSAQLHTHVQRSIEAAIEMGKQRWQVCCLSLSFCTICIISKNTLTKRRIKQVAQTLQQQ